MQRQRYEQHLDDLVDPAGLLEVLARGEATRDWLALIIHQLFMTDLELADAHYWRE